MSKYSKIGNGVIVMHSAVIYPGAIIGNNSIINSKALIEHDAGNHAKAFGYLEHCLKIWKNADEDFAPAVEAKHKWAEWNQIN